MGFYFLITICFSTICICGNSKYIKINSLVAFRFISLVLILLGGLRWFTGTDWIPYQWYFEGNYDWASFNKNGFEKGFAFLNFFIKHISESYTFFLLIFHALVIIPKICFLQKNSVYPLFSLFLYWLFYCGDIFAVRQMLGVSLLIISIPYISNKNIKPFLLLTILATLVHRACFFWILAYHIYHLMFSKRKWAFILFLSFCAMIISPYVLPKIVHIIFSPLGAYGTVFEKILFYTDEYTEPMSTPLKLIFSLIKRFMILPLFLLSFNKLVSISKYNRGMLNLFFAGNVFYLLCFLTLQQFSRLLVPFLFFEVILIPSYLKTIRTKCGKELFIIFILLYAFIKFYFYLSQFNEVLIPYYSIFGYQNRFI
ncbi:MAG: EpsG family protein [Treponema sp.]|nr:EpsG family protein [Treponema sp.]